MTEQSSTWIVPNGVLTSRLLPKHACKSSTTEVRGGTARTLLEMKDGIECPLDAHIRGSENRLHIFS
jgi:hypothetical protein